MSKIKVLGLVGQNGVGKSTICDFLKNKKGYKVYSLSDYVREYVQEKGLPLVRENLIVGGTELKEKHGQTVLAQKTYEKAISENGEKVVFDSIRNAGEVAFLKSKGVFILGVKAPIETRYEWTQSRGTERDNVDLETFKSLEAHETQGKSSGQNLSAAFEACDTIIFNDGTVDELFKKIEGVLEEEQYV